MELFRKKIKFVPNVFAVLDLTYLLDIKILVLYYTYYNSITL